MQTRSAGAGALNGLVATIRRVAQRRKQNPSTAHALLVLLQQDPESAQALVRRGLKETALISALKFHTEEPSSAIEVACERAVRIAERVGQSPRAYHFLAAIVREPRTSAHRCLLDAAIDTTGLLADVMGDLGVEDATARPTRRARQLQARPTVPPVPRTRAVTAARRVESAEPVAKADAQPPQARTEGVSGISAPPNRPKRPSASPRMRERGAPPVLGPHDLDPERFPLLARLGRNLTAAAEAGEIDPVVGREREIDRLLDVLARRRANNPVLVGPPGVGKTAVVEGLALRLIEEPEGSRLAGTVLVELSAGALVGGTGVRGALAERLRQLRQEVSRSEGRVLLFLDEIHAIVGGEGPDDIANELKAALARGELPCIGATTEAEFRRSFERDAALARRFSRIEVGEPSPSEAVAILRSIAPSYERHHAVAYDPAALKAAVELTIRYVPEGHLPDKAIAALDLAAARVRRRGGSVVDRPAVARVVAEQAQVPLERILMRDTDRLLRLEEHLRERIVGQREVLSQVADALRKGAAGFRGARPLGTFLFLGPTGVGKTETAKAISDLLFAGSGVTRFDMSELSEPHAVARLLGAPPGYVGHEDGGQLTEAVRRRPYQLILLDEIEKAHPEVLLALLPLLDEGRLTDGRGRTVDFTNTIIVMTSNLGAEATRSSGPRVGFGATRDTLAGDQQRDAAIALARRALPPELFGRIDEPLFFAPLGSDEVAQIARGMLAGVREVLRVEHRIELEIEESAIAALVAAGGYDPELGARPMRRIVGRLVEAPLASLVLGGGLHAGSTIRLFGEGATVRLESLPLADAAE